MNTPDQSRRIILGVAASDAHAVANQLIAHDLRALGYDVVNLGTCTPIEEFARAAETHPETLAVLIGSVNGHIHEDLRELKSAQRAGRITCPVVVGGNLSVGAAKSADSLERLRQLGVDYILSDADELPALLAEIARLRSLPVRSAS
ncbi:cobalamin-dependent protein [Rhodococcus qingshengii]|uniref:cobalamin-dependent protein n=1 Tax=Rhodococcus qingshengii TaxID=334542 RepID=UPI0021B14065|nr:cobalamin-dependent protein [Rhodococcus qingshengii]MCT6736584.1 cobalamin-dependent protein [Rhodococcus qingshengii]